MAAPLVIAGGRRTAGRPGGRAAVLPTPASGPDLIVMPHTKPLYLRVIRRADYVQRRADCATAATLTSSLSKQLDAGGRHRPRRGAAPATDIDERQLPASASGRCLATASSANHGC